MIDNRDKLQDQPGLHALIVGVSAYRNLPNQNEPSKPETMRQLSSTALTAYKVYCWLLEHQRNLPIPLATCRLLLSPSIDEVAAMPELNGLADYSCILNNFLLAAMDWRKDAGSNPGNMTFFYFAGHGAQRTKDDAVLLLEDFGDGIGGYLKNAVDINNIFKGMAKSQAYPNMAQTQLYFVDACRDFLPELKNHEIENTTQVFRVELTGEDNRMAPIFFAAAPGTQAYSFRNQTLFSKYLLDCLNGEAGKFEEEQDLWSVSVYSLSRGLMTKIDEWNKTSIYKQDFVPSGFMKEFDILFLDQAPKVRVVLYVEPLDALNYTRINVLDDGLNPLSELIPFPIPPKLHPYQDKWTAGTYTISAEIEPEDPRFVKFTPKSIQVMPPYSKRKIKVAK